MIRRIAFVSALALAPGQILAESVLDGIVSGAGLKGFVTVDRLPIPDDPILNAGRAVWADTCEACHGGNKATGAPKITSQKKWQKRIATGLPVLITHATEGFLGKTYAQMPARGGNPDLSDAQVASAVLFMVWASGGAKEARAYIDTEIKE